MSIKKINHKILEQVVYDETYRTDTSTLLAYDSENNTYLFRALNSNYFLQEDDTEIIKVIEPELAEEIWSKLPEKYIKNITAAFPQRYGGIGVDTYTNLYDD